MKTNLKPDANDISIAKYESYLVKINSLYFRKLYDFCEGNISLMARTAKLSRPTIKKRLSEVGLYS